jgi:hypothetical protein
MKNTKKIYKKNKLKSKRNTKKTSNKYKKTSNKYKKTSNKYKKFRRKGGAYDLLTSIKDKFLGNTKGDTLNKYIKGDENGSIIRTLMNNADKITVGNILPKKKDEETESIETYDQLEQKNKEIRNEDTQTQLDDKDLEEKLRILKKLKDKEKEKNPKSISSGVINTLTSAIGFKSKEKEQEKELEDIERDKEIIDLARSRNCNAGVIIGLNDLLNTCSKTHLIDAYNKTVEILRKKKANFNPITKKEIDRLINLEYNETDETNKENMSNLNFDELTENEDIKMLKSKIEKSLGKKN